MRSHEVSAVAGLDGSLGQGDGKMGFSDPRRAQQDYVGRLMYEAQGAQLADLALADGGLEVEVELVEGLHIGQMRQLQSGPEIALAPGVSFGVHHFEQVVGIGWLFLRRRLQQAFETCIDGGQAERCQRGAQLLDRSHSAPPHQPLVGGLRPVLNHWRTLRDVDQRLYALPANLRFVAMVLLERNDLMAPGRRRVHGHAFSVVADLDRGAVIVERDNFTGIMPGQRIPRLPFQEKWASRATVRCSSSTCG